MKTVIFVNGQAQKTVSALDRGLLYGDSLYETVAVMDGKELMLDAHIERLKEGVSLLGFSINIDVLYQDFESMLEQCQSRGKFVVRITLTRGEQSRGYQPIEGQAITRILSLHEWPNYPTDLYDRGMSIGHSHVKYAQQPLLAGIKHGNRLEQVLAAQSVQSGFDDVLMLDTQNNVISTSKGNIFIQLSNEWLTPDLVRCGINGIVRSQLIEYFDNAGIRCKVADISFDELNDRKENITAALCCNSIMGVMPISHLLSQNINSIQISQKLRNELIRLQVIAI